MFNHYISKIGLCGLCLLFGIITFTDKHNIYASHKIRHKRYKLVIKYLPFYYSHYTIYSHHNYFYFRKHFVKHDKKYKFGKIKNFQHIRRYRNFQKYYKKAHIFNSVPKLKKPKTSQYMIFSDGSVYYWFPHESLAFPVWQNIIVNNKKTSGVNLTYSSIKYKPLIHFNSVPIHVHDFESQVRQSLLIALNRDRWTHNRHLLYVKPSIQKIANIRARDAFYGYEHYNNYIKYAHNTSNPSDNWIHGVDTHQTFPQYLRKYHYHTATYWGENASDFSDGYSKFAHESGGKSFPYLNTIPQGIAYNVNDNYMNNDWNQGNYNGHRKNILNSNYKYVGIGVYYNKQYNVGADVEDFEG